MGKKRIAYKLGDIFAIPIDLQRYAYGQVVVTSRKTDDWIVIYDVISEDVTSDLKSIIQNPILFLVQTDSVCIEDGLWPVIGNMPIPDNLIFPTFKEETLNGFVVVDYRGSVIGKASEEEVRHLRYRESWSSYTVFRAVKARYGNGAWEPYYDEMLCGGYTH